MVRKKKLTHLRTWALSGAALIAVGGVALLGGCKGNTTSAAGMAIHAEKPPVVTASRAAMNMKETDPLTSSAWRNALAPLVPPVNTLRTTAPTRAGVLFDDETLYVAFVSERQPGSTGQSRDAVTLFLDPLCEGKELFQVTVDSTGATSCTWLRSSEPAEALEDGSPDWGHPVVATPDMKVSGMWTQVREGTDEGHSVWTCQLALPVAGLPKKLQVKPAAGAHWKFNLVRTYATIKDGRVVDQAQANLSPFYVNAQAVSPYRLADLGFADTTNKLATNER